MTSLASRYTSTVSPLSLSTLPMKYSNVFFAKEKDFYISPLHSRWSTPVMPIPTASNESKMSVNQMPENSEARHSNNFPHYPLAQSALAPPPDIENPSQKYDNDGQQHYSQPRNVKFPSELRHYQQQINNQQTFPNTSNISQTKGSQTFVDKYVQTLTLF